MISDYKILWSDSVKGLQSQVNAHISSGWVLQGGVAVQTKRQAYETQSSFYVTDTIFYQAMVK